MNMPGGLLGTALAFLAIVLPLVIAWLAVSLYAIDRSLRR